MHTRCSSAIPALFPGSWPHGPEHTWCWISLPAMVSQRCFHTCCIITCTWEMMKFQIPCLTVYVAFVLSWKLCTTSAPQEIFHNLKTGVWESCGKVWNNPNSILEIRWVMVMWFVAIANPYIYIYRPWITCTFIFYYQSWVLFCSPIMNTHYAHSHLYTCSVSSIGHVHIGTCALLWSSSFSVYHLLYFAKVSPEWACCR